MIHFELQKGTRNALLHHISCDHGNRLVSWWTRRTNVDESGYVESKNASIEFRLRRTYHEQRHIDG
jgi:hypothetical protein